MIIVIGWLAGYSGCGVLSVLVGPMVSMGTTSGSSSDKNFQICVSVRITYMQ